MDFTALYVFLAALFAMAELSNQQLLDIGTEESTAAEEVTSTLPTTIQKENMTEGKCYDGLGCFDTNSPWSPPAPMDPKEINTTLYLFTRRKPDAFKVTLWPDIDLEGSDYDPQRPTTAFIVHGFNSNTSNEWMHEMKNAYLENVDANVFLVDWGKGAKQNYLQAASNTRIVGAELGRCVKHFVMLGQKPGEIHLIGHSLGAHTSGYCGKIMAADSLTIARITAMDPAQPDFEGRNPKTRVTKNDADFVDVLHTDARPFIPLLGFGMLGPVGHVDFYMNGGSGQPGCSTVEVPQNITSVSDIAEIPVGTFSKWLTCSHLRAYEYFTWSLKNKDCLFVGRKMSTAENALKIGTLGTLRLIDPVISYLKPCAPTNCSVIGLKTPEIPARGIFAVETNAKPPYCMTKEDEMRVIYNSLSPDLF